MTNPVVILSERNAEWWGGRGVGELADAQVCTGLGDALRAIALERPRVLIVELPVETLGHGPAATLFVDHPMCECARLIFVSEQPDRLPVGLVAHPAVSVLVPPVTPEALAGAISRSGELGAGNWVSWDREHTAAWLSAMADAGPQKRAVALIARLSVLTTRPLDVQGCGGTLRYLAPRVRAVAKHIPRVIHAVRVDSDAESVVARLGWAWIGLLESVLRTVDTELLSDRARHRARCWLLSETLRMLALLVELHALWGAALGRGVWARLHDLHLYVHRRLLGEEAGAGDAHTAAVLWEIRHRYVTSLLLGCCAARLSPSALTAKRAHDLVPRWARRTALREPVGQEWGRGRWLVYLGEDAGPRFVRVRQDTSLGSYLLVPPSAFDAFLADEKRPEPLALVPVSENVPARHRARAK